jgi:hypothetical protein
MLSDIFFSSQTLIRELRCLNFDVLDQQNFNISSSTPDMMIIGEIAILAALVILGIAWFVKADRLKKK